MSIFPGIPSHGLAFLLAFAPLPAAADELATVPAAYREVDRLYAVEGAVEAVRQSTVAAQISGRVVEIRFDVGDAVRKGEVIVRIDEREVSDSLAAAQAQIAQAQAALQNAQANYERTRQLFQQKFMSQAALDHAFADYRAAEAQLEGAVAIAGQAATVREFATVTAPYSGVVAARHVELGETVTPGKPLMTGFDPKELRVVAAVPQLRLAQVRASTMALIEFPALGEWVKTSAITVLPAADAATHTMRVRLALPHYVSGSYPGMFARVHFSIGRARKLVIPFSAVVRRSEVTGVYVVSERQTIRFRQVRLGESAGASEVEVLAGLKPGERVAIDPVRAAMALRGAAAAR
jgi:RND family efflux transporter MFP subunit